MDLAEDVKLQGSGVIGYFQALTGVLSRPGAFFSSLEEDIPMGKPLGFLIACALFYTGASLTCLSHGHAIMAGVYLLNSLLMPILSAGACFLVMTMFLGRRVTFKTLVAVHAYAAGVTMLAAWIPLFVWFTEPWKWCLITLGMVKAGKLTWLQSILVALASIFLISMFFWSMMPVIAGIKGA
ncbi:MAG: hypothetical protein JEZ02_08630 [Desulfatibacillum sp.]|nr:hypothetical protein [Desulfatibacillum sp.]